MASRGRPRCFSCHRPVPAQEKDVQRCTYCRVLRFCSPRCLDRSWDTHAPICKSIQKKWKRPKDVSLPPAKAKTNVRLVCFACGKAPATVQDIGKCAGCRAVPFCKTAACQARVKETHSGDCKRIVSLVEEARKKEEERATKAKVDVVVVSTEGAICQRRTYRFEDSVAVFFLHLQSVMDVDLLKAETSIEIFVDGEKVDDWDGTIMGDIIDVDTTFMVVLD